MPITEFLDAKLLAQSVEFPDKEKKKDFEFDRQEFIKILRGSVSTPEVKDFWSELGRESD